ncbi:Carotenoid cleavage dioxygenase [Halorientalis persicus]|uniref:Carotenoid cleavage dioxygenase n=1 Tax=Halorientalis persicus TaxID=1367881 RepID=A0A1H8TD66_9EURY|nr:carotenoid oxygenase family protein [Halorientalis persicus]SEO89040.1 Carotenoid cleavage dioxygenase [Halorientalis persicus]
MSRRTAAELGFRTLRDERTGESLPVAGTVPTWLSGTLLRNGPGRFDAGGGVNHWFDGLAMLRRYSFTDGEVEYTNRFLRTEAYDRAEAGEPTRQFATGASGLAELRRWIRALGPPEPTDNANVHLARIGDRFVAQTEVPRWIEFDPHTLETVGEFTFEDGVSTQMATAHFVVDDHCEESIGYGLSFGRRTEYVVYRVPHGSDEREVIGRVTAEGPGYVHSLSVTPNYVVLLEPPLHIDVLRGLAPWTEGFAGMLSYDADAETRIVVLDRATGEIVADPTVDPCFVFHHVNAFERDGTVVLDLVAFEDADIVDALSLAELRSGGFAGAPDGHLYRYRVDPRTGEVATERRHPGGIELPTVPPAVRTKPYRYAYGQATDRAGANGLVKVDVEAGTATEWWEAGTYVEEPRMVQRPDGDREDEGVVLATALDTDAERTYLLVFDAETLTLRARARLPHAVPFGFHGRYFPAL